MTVQILFDPVPDNHAEFDHPEFIRVEFDYIIPVNGTLWVLSYWDGVYAGTYDFAQILLEQNGRLRVRALVNNSYTQGITISDWLTPTGHLQVDYTLTETVVTLNGGEKQLIGPPHENRSLRRGTTIIGDPGYMTNLAIFDLSLPAVVPGGGDLYRWSQKLHWIQRFIVDLDSVCMWNVCDEQTVWDVCAEENWFDVCEENCT